MKAKTSRVKSPHGSTLIILRLPITPRHHFIERTLIVRDGFSGFGERQSQQSSLPLYCMSRIFGPHARSSLLASRTYCPYFAKLLQ